MVVQIRVAQCLAAPAGKRHIGESHLPKPNVRWFRVSLLRNRDDLEDLPMTDAVKVGFVPFSAAPRGVLVVFCDDTLKFGAATRKTLGAAADLVGRAADTN